MLLYKDNVVMFTWLRGGWKTTEIQSSKIYDVKNITILYSQLKLDYLFLNYRP